MAAVRCNECLAIWIMRDGCEDCALVALVCPYCGGSARFSIREAFDSLQEATQLFAQEEREAEG